MNNRLAFLLMVLISGTGGLFLSFIFPPTLALVSSLLFGAVVGLAFFYLKT